MKSKISMSVIKSILDMSTTPFLRKWRDANSYADICLRCNVANSLKNRKHIYNCYQSLLKIEKICMRENLSKDNQMIRSDQISSDSVEERFLADQTSTKQLYNNVTSDCDSHLNHSNKSSNDSRPVSQPGVEPFGYTRELNSDEVSMTFTPESTKQQIDNNVTSDCDSHYSNTSSNDSITDNFSLYTPESPNSEPKSTELIDSKPETSKKECLTILHTTEPMSFKNNSELSFDATNNSSLNETILQPVTAKSPKVTPQLENLPKEILNLSLPKKSDKVLPNNSQNVTVLETSKNINVFEGRFKLNKNLFEVISHQGKLIKTHYPYVLKNKIQTYVNNTCGMIFKYVKYSNNKIVVNAICKAKGCKKFKIYIINGEEATVFSNSLNYSHTDYFTLQSRGVERKINKNQLAKTKPSNFKNQLLANNIGDNLDQTKNLQNIKSDATFRKMRAEALSMNDRSKNDFIDLILYQKDHIEFVRQVSFPFTVKMFCKEQIEVLKRTKKTLLHFDATGSVVRKLKLDELQTVESKRILYYAGVIRLEQTQRIFPVFSMLTATHNTNSIFNLLHDFRDQCESKNLWPAFSGFVTDFSFANIHSAVRAFNQCSLNEYLELAYNIAADNSDKKPIQVPVFLCCAHYTKMLCNDVDKIVKNSDGVLKNLLANMQQIDTLHNFDAFVKHLYIVLNSKHNNYTVSVSLDTLKVLCTSKNRVIVNTTLSNALIESSGSSLYANSPFYKRFNDIIQQVKIIEVEGSENPYFCPEMWSVILTKYLPLVPLWSNLLKPERKLHFLSPPPFQVERVNTSSCSSRICVWGSRGVTVAELPSRWGRGGLFDSGNEAVLCKSYSLDERFLYSQTEVRRVQWHPSSLSHLLVLVSDNTIRLYNIALKSGPKLVKIFTIGPKPSSQLAGKTILDSLGDTAVDFTPTPDTKSLLILRGNGDVYMLQCDLDSKSPLQPKLSGPLAMYPPADDNYGTDSCSIVALGGGDAPALLVVGTCSAALYHCLLLPNPTEKEDGDTHSLYVVETVELNIVLNPDDLNLQHSYPVHLYSCSSNTYACVHAGGVHTVTLPILRQLKDYAMADDAESETLLSAISSSPSIARHLVCTSAADSLSPPAGVSVASQTTNYIVILCADSNVLTRTLEPYDFEEQLYKEMQLKNPSLEQEDINKILKEKQKLSFTAIIKEILKRDVSQPILNISKKDPEPSPKECLEFLTQATLKLRGEYLSRQQRALDAVARKVVALRALSKQHSSWYNELQIDIDDVKLQSTVIEEKCLLAEKHQDDLKYRCSTVIRNLRASASASPAERALLNELERHQRSGERLAEQIHSLQQLAKDKSCQLKNWQEEYKKKDIALGKSHSDTISSILQQQTSQISTLIEETKLLKDQLSIV